MFGQLDKFSTVFLNVFFNFRELISVDINIESFLDDIFLVNWFDIASQRDLSIISLNSSYIIL